MRKQTIKRNKIITMNRSSCTVILNEHDDMFNYNVDAYVCPVNCLGIMGKGLALKFKKKYPDYFKFYQYQCRQKKVTIGKVLPYYNRLSLYPTYIFSFPTKFHWRESSKIEYIKSGLQSLKRDIIIYDIHTIAIPALGCGLGKLDFDDVSALIERKLITILNLTIYLFQPQDGSWKKNNY